MQAWRQRDVCRICAVIFSKQTLFGKHHGITTCLSCCPNLDMCYKPMIGDPSPMIANSLWTDSRLRRKHGLTVPSLCWKHLFKNFGMAMRDLVRKFRLAKHFDKVEHGELIKLALRLVPKKNPAHVVHDRKCPKPVSFQCPMEHAIQKWKSRLIL